MAQRKLHHYVLVFTSEGAKYVTGVGEHHIAYWDDKKPPKEFSVGYAEDMALGLTWNGNPAVRVTMPCTIDRQPYLYEVGHFEWHLNKESEETE